MELKFRGWYVKLSSGINTTRNTNTHTPVYKFCNNKHLVHERAIICFAKYRNSTTTYVDLRDDNKGLTARRLVYRPDIENSLSVVQTPTFPNGWAEADAYNAEYFM